MTKDERIKELESVAMQLFDMVHESENIQNKIKANDLYDTIIGQSLRIDSVSGTCKGDYLQEDNSCKKWGGECSKKHCDYYR